MRWSDTAYEVTRGQDPVDDRVVCWQEKVAFRLGHERIR